MLIIVNLIRYRKLLLTSYDFLMTFKDIRSSDPASLVKANDGVVAPFYMITPT